jgi:hypothetical protein
MAIIKNYALKLPQLSATSGQRHPIPVSNGHHLTGNNILPPRKYTWETKSFHCRSATVGPIDFRSTTIRCPSATVHRLTPNNPGRKKYPFSAAELSQLASKGVPLRAQRMSYKDCSLPAQRRSGPTRGPADDNR